MMKKSKFFYLCCIICLFTILGCSRNNEDKRVVGSNDEIVISFVDDILNSNYTDLKYRYKFSGNIGETIRTGRFESILKPYFDQFGNFKEQEQYYQTKSEQFTSFVFPTHFENESVNIVVIINQNQEIIDLNFESYQED